MNNLWDKLAVLPNTLLQNLNGYIKKSQEKYSLTRKGKEIANQLFNNSLDIMPIIGVLIVLFDSKDRVLCYKRLKQPSYGYYAFPGGKMTSKEYPIETAQRKLKDDVGLHCDLKLEGMFLSKTYVDEELSYNNQLFIFSGKNPSGKLIKENYKGEHVWIHPIKVPKTKKYPEFESILEIVNSKNFKVVEMDRFKEEDTFVNFNIIKK